MPLGAVHARADHLAFLTMDLAGAQVAHATLLKAPDAGVADAHPAAEREQPARLLAGHEDRRGPVAVGREVGDAEAHRAAGAGVDLVAADDRLEALHVQQRRIAGLLPVRLHRVEHPARSREEGLALAPVRAQPLQLGGGEPALARALAHVQAIARPATLEVAEV